MNSISIYSAAPVFMQNLLCTLHGYKLKKQRFNEEYVAISEFLNTTSNWSEEQIKSYKEENLHKIIEHAYNHCPYYRMKYSSAKLTPNDFKSLDDLKKFPVLMKEEVRENWKNMVATEFPRKKLVAFNTSGTTGKALNFYLTSHSIPYYWAIDQRYKDRFGFHLGDSCLNFSGRPIVPLNVKKPPYWRHDKILNRYFLNMQQISADKISSILSFINSKSIDFFIGYPSIMTALALEIETSGIALNAPPRHIFTGAEKIYENQIEIIQRVFKGVHIHELYSFSEQAAIATHCTEGIYHEDFEFGHMELHHPLKVENGLQGEILATGFANYGMPFIRYQNGDTAIFSNSNCKCGLKSQVIQDIVGRNEDYILTPEGTKIQRLDYVFKDTPEIKECQVVQRNFGEIVLRIVKRDTYSIHTEKKLRTNIRQWISPGLVVSFEYLDEIPRTKAGKFKAVVSALKQE